MVHRDIKPSNLLVQRWTPREHSPGLLKISDFGLARLNAPSLAAESDHAGTILTRQNTVMGTPDYLSPEQARDLHRVDIRSDLYSLGCTFYYLLTGQAPFPGGTAIEKLIRHSAEDPAPLTECRPDVPAPVLAIVRRLLSKTPDERYQTPRELAEALEPYAVSGPTPWAAAPPPSSVDLDAVTPLNESTNILEGHSSDEWSSLTQTSPSDPTPTPLNATDRPRSRSRPRRSRLLRRTILTCLAGAAVTLLAGLAVAMALLQ